MSYCLNPRCQSPPNPDAEQFCRICGAKLLLKDRYRPVEPIGRGGFGRTFLAIDGYIPSQPSCVIKQLWFPNSDPETFNKVVALFRQEAMRLDELGKHPQIPQLLAYFEQEEQLYLVQEFIPGKTLLQELQQQGVYNEMQIWELLRDLLPVLQFIHKHRVIHRDIKPPNIIRRTSQILPEKSKTKGGELVLIDFGVAKLLTNTALIHTGTIIGSPEYMPPEQTRGVVFPSSDLYSLGVTCIHLLTGVSPLDMFDFNNDRWAWHDFLPKGTQVSLSLAKILDKLLQNRIKERYQSADEVLQVVNSTPPTLGYKPHGGIALVSQIGINYTRLRDLLATRHWKEADRETWTLLCQASGKRIGSYLFNGDIDNLPCEDLWTIDQLWLKYSDGRFGFSVQKKIYEEVGGEYSLYCDRIGWPIHNPAILEYALTFSHQAPLGHLPSRQWVGGYSWWRHAQHLAIRLEQCGIGYSGLTQLLLKEEEVQ